MPKIGISFYLLNTHQIAQNSTLLTLTENSVVYIMYDIKLVCWSNWFCIYYTYIYVLYI